MAEIKLASGEIAVVDAEDFEWLNSFSWFLSTDGYAITTRPTRYMHRLVMKTLPGEECDHKHHNRLDNRKSELRNVTKAFNQQNRLPTKNKTFKGVTFQAGRNKWMAQIRVTLEVGRKTLFLGRFDDITEAAKAYNQAAIRYFGKHAWLNPI